MAKKTKENKEQVVENTEREKLYHLIEHVEKHGNPHQKKWLPKLKERHEKLG